MAVDPSVKGRIVVQLLSDVPRAKRKLAELLINSHPSGEALGWGQYLRSSPPGGLPIQTGIFGTAAALEILTTVDAGNYADRIRDGLSSLPLVGPAPPVSPAAARDQKHYADKGDLKVTYKVAALLDVATVISRGERPGLLKQGAGAKAVGALLGNRVDGGAWRDHPLAEDTNPHATAVALLSLSQAEPPTVEVAKAVGQAHLRFEGVDFDEVAVSTTAILLMALQNLRAHELYADPLSNWAELEKAAESSLINWVQSSSARGVLRSLEATEYASPLESEAENAPANGRWSFMLYLPHVVISQAILTSEVLRARTEARQFVLVVMQEVVKRLLEKGRFVTDGRKQALRS